MNNASSLVIVFIGIVFAACSNALALVDAPALPPSQEMRTSENREASDPASSNFSPLTLRDCYQLARERSEALAMQKVDIEKTWADFMKAAGETLGDVTYKITNLRQDAREDSSGGSDATANLTRYRKRERKLVIEQPLFQGFKSWGGLAGAGSLRKQRVEEKKRAEQLLFLDVVDSFYSVLRHQKDFEITRGILSLFEERMAELSDREKIGRSRLSELATAETRMRLLEADLAQIRGAWAEERWVLEFLTGTPLAERTLAGEDRAETVKKDIVNYLGRIEERPDVKAAAHASKTAFRGIIVQQSDLWPEITLENNLYEKREGTQSPIDWDLLFTIDVPVFTGGTHMGEVKEAIGEWKKSKLFLTQTTRQAELEVKQAYEAFATSLEEYRALQKAVETSYRNYGLQREDYERNLVSNLDVLEALESLNETRLEENRARYGLKKNYYELNVASGDCCEDIS